MIKTLSELLAALRREGLNITIIRSHKGFRIKDYSNRRTYFFQFGVSLDEIFNFLVG